MVPFLSLLILSSNLLTTLLFVLSDFWCPGARLLSEFDPLGFVQQQISQEAIRPADLRVVFLQLHFAAAHQLHWLQNAPFFFGISFGKDCCQQ